ncbi:hypothetical protein PFFCH_05021 [Plasmodium falciparum FCH/4]|uniref:Uncharacterized protein n=1 Tax=Plasmodium falciparum FCH/4 TaxID=1036724 RepID=A0A024VI31_PLAFA|nr:hypothetical protein PFFCH_05021 [Plasmodium falciparum FCH/4]
MEKGLNKYAIIFHLVFIFLYEY